MRLETWAMSNESAVLLIAHGSPAKDIPRSLLVEFRRLHGLEQPTEEQAARAEALEAEIRNWPRANGNDPYLQGTEALLHALQAQNPERRVLASYNEFCAPSPGVAVDLLVREGFTEISVFSTMMTPGGGHSENDIPEVLAECRQRHPGVVLRYHWPYDLSLVARVITDQLHRDA